MEQDRHWPCVLRIQPGERFIKAQVVHGVIALIQQRIKILRLRVDGGVSCALRDGIGLPG